LYAIKETFQVIKVFKTKSFLIVEYTAIYPLDKDKVFKLEGLSPSDGLCGATGSGVTEPPEATRNIFKWGPIFSPENVGR
jgi:hypothetical protein